MVYKNKLNLFLLFFVTFSSMYTVKLIGAIGVAEILCVLFFILTVIYKPRISINFFSLTFVVWLFLSLISVVFVQHYDYFSYEQYIGTSIKLIFLVLCFLMIPAWTRTDSDKFNIIHIIKDAICFHCIAQILIVFAFYTDSVSFINYIYFGDHSNRGAIFNVYDYVNYDRFGGFFEEPSWFAWYVVGFVGILVGYEKEFNKIIISPMMFFLIVIAMFFTWSVAGYISLMILFLIKHNKILNKIIVFYALILFFLLSWWFFASSPFLERVFDILSGNDGSANARIFGSLGKAVIVSSKSLFGSGIGNSLEGINFYLCKETIGGTLSNQNGFLEPFVVGGLLLGILFNAPIFSLIVRKRYIQFISISLVFFTTSAIFTLPIWIMMSLSHCLAAQKRS